jgi:hypothetical protein
VSYNFPTECRWSIKKNGHCLHAQVEDAPKVLGHASISKGAVGAMAGGGYHGQGGGT